MTEVRQLTNQIQGISCHAWSPDKSMVAISPNNAEVHIYDAVSWTCLHVLKEHDLLVSAVDWSVDNKIVTCSHDRNAFVWTFDAADGVWKPMLVILRVERAAMQVRWSSDGKKFAVATGAKSVSMCTYDESNDWWVSNAIKKKFKSTVLCCEFHPTNSQLLATGSSDFRCRIYSTFTSEVDGASVNAAPFANALEFGEAYCELATLGWVHDVAWSPSGATLAYCCHDSSISLASFPTGSQALLTEDPPVQRILQRGLPFSSVVFVNDTSLLGVGHDMMPSLYSCSAAANEWKLCGMLDAKATAVGGADTPPEPPTSGAAAARALFKAKTSRGQTSSANTNDSLKTTHESSIASIRIVGPGKVSTTAFDGRLVIWDLKSQAVGLEGALAALKL